MLKTYYLLTKPGILMGNLVTTAGGFALASRGHIDPFLFLALLLGLGPVIASACIFNNYIDRISDAKMMRTKNRPLAKGSIAPWKAIVFALVLGPFGLAILVLYTNFLAAAVAFMGFFVYVILYSFWKGSSTHATLVGSISGAVPPVVGYVAARGHLDLGAGLLFAILVLWQMPHFYAIAMFRQKDYEAASIPVLPICKGIHATKVQMLLYCIAFALSCTLLTFLGYTGKAYLVIVALLSLSWIYLSVLGFRAKNDVAWARSMFRLSLVIITMFSALLYIDPL
jgi:protoheme IX farnesyltransferase